MGLFKKKEKIPTIPTAPSLPALPALPPLESPAKESAERDLPELPSFPASSKNENLNQEMVKSAVSDVPASINEDEIPMLPLAPVPESSIPKLPKLITPAEPQKLEVPKLPIIPKTPAASATPVHLSASRAHSQKQNEPIFVRIDKFQAAQKNFDEIKSKVAEIESVLQKMKDVKTQEDEELRGWTKDTEKLKSRLAEIDSDLFSQL